MFHPLITNGKQAHRRAVYPIALIAGFAVLLGVVFGALSDLPSGDELATLLIMGLVASVVIAVLAFAFLIYLRRINYHNHQTRKTLHKPPILSAPCLYRQDFYPTGGCRYCA